MNDEDTFRRYEAELSAYIDDELAPGRRKELESALADSAELRSRLASLRRADRVLEALPATPPSRDLGARVGAALRASELAGSRDRARSGRKTWRRMAPGFAAAAAAAAAFVTWQGVKEAPVSELAQRDSARLPEVRVPEPPEESRAAPARIEPSGESAPRADTRVARETELPVETEPVPAVVAIEQEFAGVLATEEDSDRIVVEVLDFLEELGDLRESGRG